jgi:acyl-CoA reductase-like NAD-dependent aldehyde dehydrogenase
VAYRSASPFNGEALRTFDQHGGPVFRGIQRSGYGKELSDLGIQEFVNKKLICAANGFSLVA